MDSFVRSAICIFVLYVIICSVIETIKEFANSLKRKKHKKLGIKFKDVALHPYEQSQEEAEKGCGVPDAQAPATASLPFETTETEEEEY